MTFAAMLGVEVSYAKQSGCCPECLADMPDHWLHDFFRYCPHEKAVSQFDVERGEWGILRRVGRRRASWMLGRLMRHYRLEAAKNGLSTELLDKLLQFNRPVKRSR